MSNIDENCYRIFQKNIRFREISHFLMYSFTYSSKVIHQNFHVISLVYFTDFKLILFQRLIN